MSQWTAFNQLKQFLSKQIIGQERLVERLLIALLADGHLLVEGAPGLAKTKAIKELCKAIEGDFHRIQFTPDLLPSDVTGTEVYRPQDSSFVFQKGPIFHNLILADEINRAPAKVQSALLEAMGERQVSVGPLTHRLPALFLVMATQNPIEQEGTFPLPEAQLDRFLMHVKIDYPNIDAERKILQLVRTENTDQLMSTIEFTNSPNTAPSKKINSIREMPQEFVFQARKQVLDLYMLPAVEEYIIQLVMATRTPGDYGDHLANSIEYGVSPRGTIALDRCARAHAWLNNRDYVTPEDVQYVAPDTLRHRLGISFEAEAKGITCDQIIREILDQVAAP